VRRSPIFTIDTPAGHFQAAEVAFPDDVANQHVIATGTDYPYGGSDMYDDRVLTAIEMAEGRARHGVKPPQCRTFECTNPAAPDSINRHLVEECETHQREANDVLDRTWPPTL